MGSYFTLENAGDCNHCEPSGGRCRGASDMMAMHNCPLHEPPKDKFKFFELILMHPTSLHKAMVDLKKKTGIEFNLWAYVTV